MEKVLDTKSIFWHKKFCFTQKVFFATKSFFTQKVFLEINFGFINYLKLMFSTLRYIADTSTSETHSDQEKMVETSRSHSSMPGRSSPWETYPPEHRTSPPNMEFANSAPMENYSNPPPPLFNTSQSQIIAPSMTSSSASLPQVPYLNLLLENDALRNVLKMVGNVSSTHENAQPGTENDIAEYGMETDIKHSVITPDSPEYMDVGGNLLLLLKDDPSINEIGAGAPLLLIAYSRIMLGHYPGGRLTAWQSARNRTISGVFQFGSCFLKILF